MEKIQRVQIVKYLCQKIQPSDQFDDYGKVYVLRRECQMVNGQVDLWSFEPLRAAFPWISWFFSVQAPC